MPQYTANVSRSPEDYSVAGRLADSDGKVQTQGPTAGTMDGQGLLSDQSLVNVLTHFTFGFEGCFERPASWMPNICRVQWLSY